MSPQCRSRRPLADTWILLGSGLFGSADDVKCRREWCGWGSYFCQNWDTLVLMSDSSLDMCLGTDDH